MTSLGDNSAQRNATSSIACIRTRPNSSYLSFYNSIHNGPKDRYFAEHFFAMSPNYKNYVCSRDTVKYGWISASQSLDS